MVTPAPGVVLAGVDKFGRGWHPTRNAIDKVNQNNLPEILLILPPFGPKEIYYPSLCILTRLILPVKRLILAVCGFRVAVCQPPEE
jgi:hypothetical protein